MLQTFLAHLPLRSWGKNEMAQRSRGELVWLADGTCLEGFYTPHVGAKARGLVVFLSGWEGHAGSPYVLCTGRMLWSAGYEVFRLNFPDHGDTHDLTEEIFNLGMMDKIFEALGRLASSIRTRPIYLIGFSMGGNFALNAALRGLPGLRMTVAISPALDLMKALRTLESHPFFHDQFLKEWRQSLLRKQELYPYRYDLEYLKRADTIGQVASELISRYYNGRSLEEFYSPYTVTPERLRELRTTTHILAAMDDPIIGPFDVEAYKNTERLTLHVFPHGGHVGFMRGLFTAPWYEPFILSMLSQPVDLGSAKMESDPPSSGDRISETGLHHRPT